MNYYDCYYESYDSSPQILITIDIKNIAEFINTSI